MPLPAEPASRLPVVVTRPLQQAQAFADAVRQLGRAAVVFPLLQIAPVEDVGTLRATLSRLQEFALVVFVSPNAIDAAFAHLDGWPSELPIGIVGEGSRLALCAHGVQASNTTLYGPQRADKMDSEELLKSLPLEQLRGRRALIVRGQSGRDFLSEALQQHGVMVEHLTAYRRLAPVLDAQTRPQLLDLLDGGADWVITSSEALRNLLELARLAGGEERVVKLQRQRIFVSHHRIAENAREQGFVQVIQTGSGDERLLAALAASAT
ncbi:uroporphyrinogen-III synthase [Herbaspirillum frisingense GSF30]|uniref:Uroporphyrinogen-III synthase n=1 Tax=Herbaspirillum frisingense GSF30 TaxID=864073 RepID=A0AAI9IEX3_9BURK|nr:MULTISPECIES: uroporphyrinogen-III synthase [Herbaspirillum]EOA04842.1 uroporphyrinogen-III synthase [Herbaspirillum frisingense GSF30]MCI1013387.1 uroporphyrinogen-III synthase [Herbaspirillum sp. C7C2]